MGQNFRNGNTSVAKKIADAIFKTKFLSIKAMRWALLKKVLFQLQRDDS